MTRSRAEWLPPARAAAAAALLSLLGGGAACRGALPRDPRPTPANYTAADCPGSSCFAGAPNGCGSRSLSIIAAEIVPDKWPGGVDFTAACNAHDTCYFTLGSKKDECDRTFLEAMTAECDRAVRCIDVPVLGRQCGGNPLYDTCGALAEGYYKAVSAVGQESFDRDQRDQQAHVQQCVA